MNVQKHCLVNGRIDTIAMSCCGLSPISDICCFWRVMRPLTRIFPFRVASYVRQKRSQPWCHYWWAPDVRRPGSRLFEGMFLSPSPHPTDKAFHWRFNIASTSPLLHYITFGLLQRTLGELQRGCPQENAANPGQCRSSGLLRTSS